MTDYVVTTLDDENDAGETEAGVLGAGLAARGIERAKSARDYYMGDRRRRADCRGR